MSAAALNDLIEAGGLGLAITTFDAARPDTDRSGAPGVVRLGVHRSGPAPVEGLEACDILLSADPGAPSPWVGLPPAEIAPAVASLQAVVARQPVAAAVAAQVLRTTLTLPFDQALVLESLAYSTLLAGESFRAWRAATPVRRRGDHDHRRVGVAREAGKLIIRLTRPSARNAFDARMRDALVEALEFALIDPDQAPVVLSGEGDVFSAGGDLDEFGQADDPGRAHIIRTLRSPAHLGRRLGDRLTARLHGACIGAGIEIPAACGRVLARPGTVFRLPEVSMGLIPGAGGTASIPRRIGRHRACYMTVSGCDLSTQTALAWGLVDGLDSDP